MTTRANDSLGEASELERTYMEAQIEEHVENILLSLRLPVLDPNLVDTPERIAKMFVREIFAGRFQDRPEITTFPNDRGLDEVYTVGPIVVRSTCSHHFAPVIGSAWVGVIPGDRILGLSKFARLVSWVMARPQIQEEATIQLADEIGGLIEPRALGVVVKAKHFCMVWRGVREHATEMVTSVMRGAFRENPAARAEFFSLIAGQGFKP